MLKKSLIVFVTILTVLLISTAVFASNVSMSNSVSNGINNVRNVIGGAENAVEKGVSGVANAVEDGWNDIADNNDNANRTDNDAARTDAIRTTGTNPGGYDATRTATTTNVLGNTSNIWTWMILAILGIVIISLVWYYSTQNTTDSNYHSNDE